MNCKTTCCKRCRNWLVKKARCRYGKYFLNECYPTACKGVGEKCSGFRRKPKTIVNTARKIHDA